jgi:sugar phosphate isomerase/epimerase
MAIKIAAFPKCFEYDIGLYRTMSVFDWIEMAQGKLNVEGLEMYERFFTNLDRGYLLRVAEAVADAGFVIPMFICSPDFTHPDADERKRAIEYQAKMIEVTALLGGPGAVCRVLSGQHYAQITREQGVEWVIQALHQVIPVARENDVILGMENHYKDSQWKYPEFALRMDVFLEIVDAIDERCYFGVQYDPSNALVAGDDPIELLEKVKYRVVSMHASDRYLKEGMTLEQLQQNDDVTGYASSLFHGVIGEGLNDYDKIFSILSAVGYDGWMSIEDGLKGLDEMRKSAEFLQRMREKYSME